MKHIIISLLFWLGISSCVSPTPPASTTDAQTTINTPPYETVKLVYIANRSKIFVRHYTYPAPAMFKPLLDKISSTATLDFRYGLIRNYSSDITFERFYAPYNKEKGKDTNPWIDNEKTHNGLQPTNWNNFAAAVNSRLIAPPCKGQDIAAPINHAITIFQEGTKRNGVRDDTHTLKVLILCTDFRDPYSEIPTIPQDIEVIVVGVMPRVPVEHILNTPNVRRFESLEAALHFLINQQY